MVLKCTLSNPRECRYTKYVNTIHYLPITRNYVEMYKTQKNLSKRLYSQLFIAVFYPSLCHQVSNTPLKVIDALAHFFQ